MSKVLMLGTEVKFIPYRQKETLNGIIVGFLVGSDKKDYCKIKVGTKIYTKQINTLYELN